MRIFLTFSVIALLAFWLADCSTSKTSDSAAGGSGAPKDPLAADRAKYLNRVKQDIAGKENTPADSLFLNIKIFKNMPAERFLGIMDRWGATLGVSCDHCHVTSEWASDTKGPKEIARQMVALTERVNKDIGSIGAIKSEHPGVSCYTCHRGDVKPARRTKGS